MPVQISPGSSAVLSSGCVWVGGTPALSMSSSPDMTLGELAWWMIIKAIHHSCWSNVITGDTWWHLAYSAMYSSVDRTHVGSLGVKSTTGRNIAELFPGCGSWEWSSCMQPDHRGLGLGKWQDTRHSISILLFTSSLLNGPSLVYIILPWMCLGSFCVTSFTCPIFLIPLTSGGFWELEFEHLWSTHQSYSMYIINI